MCHERLEGERETTAILLYIINLFCLVLVLKLNDPFNVCKSPAIPNDAVAAAYGARAVRALVEAICRELTLS